VKITVSIPDDVFETVQRVARCRKQSRSELVSAALREYLARHAPGEVTAAIDRDFVTAASRQVLERIEW
jgi:metal-responsive CopG/Arc/MetJ family transcriptional regulator